MNENKLIRVENLKRLNLSAVELSDRLGSGKTYWHGMLQGVRPFGEKVARKIEETLDLPRGAMDEDAGVAAAATAAYKPSGFALALAAMYDGLPHDEAIRSRAWVNAQRAIQSAVDPQNTATADAPAPGRAAKQRHG